MFWPKMAITRCLKSGSCKDSTVFAIIIVIDINLHIVPCVCVCVFVWVLFIRVPLVCSILFLTLIFDLFCH
jgi:hypothetical protein